MEDLTKNNIKSTKKRTYGSPAMQEMVQGSKLPPQAIDLEEAVLGAMMLEANALTSVIDILKPDVFYKDAHQRIFQAIINIFSRSEQVDILTVTNELKRMGELELVGGAYYISQLTSRIASSSNIEYHSRIVLQKYIQRELIRISSEITREAFEDSTDVLELLDKAERKLFAVGEDNLRRSWDDMRSLVVKAIREIEATKTTTGHLTGIPSGFTDLDRITGGWQKSNLIVVASRPGMGKTAFVLSLARNVCVEFNMPVAFFSLEMSSIELVTRLIASESGLDAEKLKKGTLQDYEWQQLHTKINKLTEAKLFIDDTPALTIFELRAKCRRLKQQHKIELIIIDYMQLMSPGNDNKGNREQEISNISRSLKSLAKELNTPVIVLSQLSREVEKRAGIKRPVLSDLRESGAIEQDADIVIFLFRPEYYKMRAEEYGAPVEGVAEVDVAKHRNGRTDRIKLNFLSHLAKFQDYDEFEQARSNSITMPSSMNEENEDRPF